MDQLRFLGNCPPTPPLSHHLGLGLRLYSSNIRRMLNKVLTRFMWSLSRIRQNQPSERKILIAGGGGGGLGTLRSNDATATRTSHKK